MEQKVQNADLQSTHYWTYWSVVKVPPQPLPRLGSCFLFSNWVKSTFLRLFTVAGLKSAFRTISLKDGPESRAGRVRGDFISSSVTSGSGGSASKCLTKLFRAFWWSLVQSEWEKRFGCSCLKVHICGTSTSCENCFSTFYCSTFQTEVNAFVMSDCDIV